MRDQKTNIVLDLDQTLIYSVPTQEYDIEKEKKKAKMFTFHDMEGYYIVFERPGVQDFLTFLFKNYNVSVWTAASKDYALFIIEKVILTKPDRKLDYIFFSYHCSQSEKRKSGTKDLRIFWEDFKLDGYNKDNTLIIDDYDEVNNTQPHNSILVPIFDYTKDNSENDHYLEDLELVMKKQLGRNVGEIVKATKQIKK